MKSLEAFIAYRHTGEKTEYLEDLLGTTRDALAQAGVKAYCTFFDEAEFQDKQLGPRDIMEHAFSIINASDMLFVLQTSNNKSEGMLMEVGYCWAKDIPVVVAVKDSVGYTYLPDMASASLRWTDLADLQKQIAATDFTAIVSSTQRT